MVDSCHEVCEGRVSVEDTTMECVSIYVMYTYQS